MSTLLEMPLAYIGIIAGSIVFLLTIGAVYALLYFGGSFDRMKKEAEGLPDEFNQTKPLLYDELLEKAKKLSKKPEEVTLSGHIVKLTPLDLEKDAKSLYQISSGEALNGIYNRKKYDADSLIWKYLPEGPFASEKEFTAYLKVLVHQEDRLVLVIRDLTSNQPLGCVSIAENAPTNLRTQLGDIWFTPAYQGSGALVESVYLLVDYLFHLGYRRVEWQCDAHDIRGRKAAHSLGFNFEGILRRHRIVKNCNRDTASFAAVNRDWPAIKEHLEAKLRKIVQKHAQASKLKSA